MANDLNPVAVLLVTSGTRGDRVLFRYPYMQENELHTSIQKVTNAKRTAEKNPYAVSIAEDLQDGKKSKSPGTSFIKDGVLVGFSNQTLANFLIVKSQLCGKPFSVEIDDVQFVGYPMSLSHLPRNQQNQPNASRQHNILAVNVVFVLRANLPESVITCYQELAQQLTVAIAYEEKRCEYLTKQAKIMLAAVDETSVPGADDSDMVSTMKLIVHHSSLAKELRLVYDGLMSNGQVIFYLNQWVEINFCLPHKVHELNTLGKNLSLESIYRCLSYLRPYHAILLTRPEQELFKFLPLDCSPALTRLIKLTAPVKNLKTLALETDLSITQIYQLVCHMVYWGFAMLIYPLCESNVYILSPSADTYIDSQLSQEFNRCFPGLQLTQEMARFSFPSHMYDNHDMMLYSSPRLIDRVNQVVVWMLQHRLLNQLHTYVNLVPARRKEFSSSSAFNHSNISSTHSSNSSVQVVEESYLSVLMEDPSTTTLDRTTSMSDLASVNSEESTGGQSTAQSITQCASQHSKSPSQEANSDGSITEDRKAQWRLQDTLLNELKPQLKAAIVLCPASKNPDDLRLFAKLCPYFNGKHHLEEMMFYENLSRSQLVALLDKFKEVLILCTHEDPATSLL
ncbi:nitrogen permease regulator 3-like protein [Plakobranchus ocellatus]|uniref:GATOR complex protein NPRL3 n=1 Tax=Plakobranchus ocellatus TaxID=259542 RepID=A0AAV3ZYH5_9GAST|nr:nitrogen permease regulator 3-like protein [Plakobranchus ocellatus]